MADRDGFIWYDGKLVPWREANTHVLTHSLHYGLAVFEGVRAYKTEIGTAIFRLQEHTDRLFNSAQDLHDGDPVRRRSTLIEAQREVVRANKLEAATCARSPSTARRRWACSPVGAGARGDRRLALGRVPRRGRPEEGHPREDLVATPATT